MIDNPVFNLALVGSAIASLAILTGAVIAAFRGARVESAPKTEVRPLPIP